MKVILSRKGLDLGFTNKPSPIIDGQPISIPIPWAWSGVNYDDIKFKLSNEEFSYRELMEDLGIHSFSECHLDPDIRKETKDRLHSWKAGFGQVGPPATELERVEVGDLFLFFGPFRQATYNQGKFQYEPKQPVRHVIWGYLEVGKIIKNPNPQEHIEHADHPHCNAPFRGQKGNVIFQAAEHLTNDNKKPGYGVFKYHSDLVLSKHPRKMSFWKPLTEWGITPNTGKRIKTIEDNGLTTYWNSGGRGQEFLFDDVVEAKWNQQFEKFKELILPE